LISKSFVARQQIDDAAIGEAVLQDVVLHNLVVAVSIYTDVRIMGEAEFHYASEDAVSIWITGYSMDYMIRLNIINPLTFIDLVVSGFGDGRKAK